MTENESIDELKRLKTEYEESVKKLRVSFALKKCKCAVGDIVKDYTGVVRLDKITGIYAPNGDSMPYLIFKGTAFTQKLVPSKRNEERSVYEVNIKEKLG